MRTRYFGIAIAAFATLGPATAWGGDREIAQQIITRLNASRESGQLKDFTLDMKVDQGVVLFRGNVSQNDQKQVVLQAVKGIDGIAEVVDQLSVTAADAMVVKRPALKPLAVTQPANVVESQFAANSRQPGDVIEPVAKTDNQPKMTIGQALQAEAQSLQHQHQPQEVSPGEVRPAAAFDRTADQKLVAGVIALLKNAQRSGELRGFGVDVKSHDGVLQLTGRAASADQRDRILRLAESVPGVSGIREAISVPTGAQEASPASSPRTPELQPIADPDLTPLNPLARQMPMQRTSPQPRTPAITASTAGGMPAMAAPYRMPAQSGAATPAMPVGMGMGAAAVGQPVPMAPYSPVGAPRYDSPNLPNYAWPGYAAYPNYAALTYPQQYSPSAWPYIGPFYPYPQVPLGWRKISLEWDDGWWFLDFTEK